MKKRFFRKPVSPVAGVLILLALCSSCHKELYRSLWQSTPVNADGNSTDWKLPMRFYNSDAKLSYSVTNDSTKLYVSVMVTDEMTQMKMLRAGFQLYVDTTGKRETGMIISYPIPRENLAAVSSVSTTTSSGSGTQWTHSHGNKNMMKVRMLSQQQFMDITGFTHTPLGTTKLTSDSGICVGVTMDTVTSVLFYEASIPLKTFYKRTITSADTLHHFSVGLVVNGIQSSGGGHGGYGGHDGGGGYGGGGYGGGGYGGGGGGYGGGGGGGYGGGGSSAYSTMTEPQKVWIPFTLVMH